MQLNQDFTYIDFQQKRWVAPKDSVVDGASIPKVFWTFIGGPFEGKYRNASVVHDVACQEKKERWEDVHLMFYNACRCGGIGVTMAKVLYTAVYYFGPGWDLVPKTVENGKVVYEKKLRTPKQPDEETAQKIKKYIETNNPSLEDIRKLKLDSSELGP